GLSRGMKGLAVRIARGINALMGTTGAVFGDRFHSHLLRTPSEVRNTKYYIRDNFRHHCKEALPLDWIDPYSSENREIQLPSPRTWLVIEGWRRAGPRRRCTRQPMGR